MRAGSGSRCPPQALGHPPPTSSTPSPGPAARLRIRLAAGSANGRAADSTDWVPWVYRPSPGSSAAAWAALRLRRVGRSTYSAAAPPIASAPA